MNKKKNKEIIKVYYHSLIKRENRLINLKYKNFKKYY